MQTDNIYQVSGNALSTTKHSDLKEAGQLPDVKLTETVTLPERQYYF